MGIEGRSHIPEPIPVNLVGGGVDLNLTPGHQCDEFAPTDRRAIDRVFPNSSRVAHRTDNSVVTFRNNAGTLSRVGLQPHHSLANFLPVQNRVNRRISIHLSTCAGSLPGDRTSAQVGLDTNHLSGPFRSSVITERVLSPDLAGSDFI